MTFQIHGTIRWRMVLAFFMGMFMTAAVAPAIPAAQISLHHTGYSHALPVLPEGLAWPDPGAGPDTGRPVKPRIVNISPEEKNLPG
jgi:hypothetical protein